MKRPLSFLFFPLLAAAVPSAASAITYTVSCDLAATTDDRALMQEAVEWLYEHRSEVLSEISSTRAQGNPHSYVAISSADAADWQVAVEDVYLGVVGVGCEYQGANYCSTSTTKLGWAGYEPILCLDNFPNLVGNDPTQVFASTVGTLAHEITHVAIGHLPHSGGATSSALNPGSAAETLGIAAEHLVLTHDLAPSIGRFQRSALPGDQLQIDVDVTLSNQNPYGEGTSALTGADRSTATDLCLYVDGVLEETRSVTDVTADDFVVESFSFVIPGYDPAVGSSVEVQAVADCGNAFQEPDESNDSAQRTLDRSVDLVIEAELAAAPVFVVGTLGSGDHFEVTFDVTATNLDSDTPSPGFDLTSRTTSGSTWSYDVAQVGSLDPGASVTASFTVDVPATPTGSGVFGGGASAWFIADYAADDVHDRDRSNNSILLELDEDWYQPDYVIESLTYVPVGSAAVPSLVYVVRNQGPVAATSASDVTLASLGTPLFTDAIPALGPLVSATPVAHQVTVPLCGSRNFSVTADAGLAIAESDETNNVDGATVRNVCGTDWHADLYDEQDPPGPLSSTVEWDLRVLQESSLDPAMTVTSAFLDDVDEARGPAPGLPANYEWIWPATVVTETARTFIWSRPPTLHQPWSVMEQTFQ